MWYICIWISTDDDFHLDPVVLFPTGAAPRSDQWEGLLGPGDQSEGPGVSTPSLPPGWWRLNLLVAARPRVIRRRALFVRWKLPEFKKNGLKMKEQWDKSCVSSVGSEPLMGFNNCLISVFCIQCRINRSSVIIMQSESSFTTQRPCLPRHN